MLGSPLILYGTSYSCHSCFLTIRTFQTQNIAHVEKLGSSNLVVDQAGSSMINLLHPISDAARF
jgi:hypothetical protein